MTSPYSSETYLDRLRAGERRLHEAGIDESAYDARLLMQAATGLSRTSFIAAAQDKMPEDIASRFDDLVSVRCGRQPLQHILGTVSFYGLDLICDARALVPRPDSETVVEAALNLLPTETACHVSDLGTGSGCLLSAILVNCPYAIGSGVEADAGAAGLARENLERLGLSGRAEIFRSSWADWHDWGQADLIISNPPYIASDEIPALMPEVRLHDPHAALDGGGDGLVAYREIITLAANRMKPGAWLVFEIGHDQRETVCDLLGTAGFSDLGTSRDLGGNDRVVWAKRPKM